MKCEKCGKNLGYWSNHECAISLYSSPILTINEAIYNEDICLCEDCFKEIVAIIKKEMIKE